jgi:hypothetical protein
MANSETLTEMERLLLMAAATKGLGPDTPWNRAHSSNVVGRALHWAGLVDDQVRTAWMSDESCPAIEECYGTLIRMIRQGLKVGFKPPERPGEPLFEGAGNFGTSDLPPAMPQFTACRLTAYGVQVAQELLEKYPEYRKIAETGSGPERCGL